jgi:hypothetical protein
MAADTPKAKVPRDPVHGFDLARYVAVAARLAEQTEPREGVLAAAGVDEMTYVDVEKTWMLRVGSAAMDGDLSLLHEYEQRYVAAQDALGPTEPTHGLDALAAIIGALAKGEDARDVLPRHRLSLAGFARLQRAWSRRMAQDDNLALVYRDMLENASR